MDGHELISARFSDSNHLNVITLWKDKDNNVVEQLISADPTQPQWNQLMKHTTEKEVWDNTTQWKFDEKKKFDAYIEPLVSAEVEKRCSIEIEKRLQQRVKESYPHIVDELEIKRNEVLRNASTIDKMATDNKTLLDDIEELNNLVKRTFREKEALSTDNQKLLRNIELQIGRIKEGHITSSTSTMAETLVNALTNHNDSSELLFKLKLEVFKIEKIKNNKVKKLKTDIRKAKTVFELFNVIKNKI